MFQSKIVYRAVTKEHEDPNYCVIKFTVGDAAGIIVRALRVFFVSSILLSFL